jgi:hypothetical protein
MARLIAPAAKVLPFLAELRDRAAGIASLPTGTPEDLKRAAHEAHAWYLLAFRALQRAFDGTDLTERLNQSIPQNEIMLRSEAEKHDKRMREQLQVIDDAIALARGALGARQRDPGDR